MRYHQILNFFRIIGIEFRRYVSSNRHFRRVKFQGIQESAILWHGRADNFGMESMRNRNLYSLNTHIGKHDNRIINGFAGTGNNGLSRAVFVSYGYITVNAFQFRIHLVSRSGNRGHFTIIFYTDFRHYFTACTDSF